MSRRRFIEAAGGTGAVASLGGCTGSESQSDGTTGSTSDSGSTSGGSSSGKTTVKFAADSTASDNSDALVSAMHEAGLSEDIDVEFIAGAWETDKRESQYQQWLSSGRKDPDLLMMDSGWHQAFIARDQCADVSKLLDDDVVSTIEDKYLEMAVATASGNDGTLYGVPFFPDIATIQYRKDLVKEAGYDPSGWATEPMSWKRFAEVTKDVKEQAETKYGFTFQAKAYEGLSCCDFNEWMSSHGGAYFGKLDNLFGPVGDRPVTVSEKAVERALRMIRTFIYGNEDSLALEGYAGPIAPKAVLQWSEEPSRKPFTSGSAVMHRNWTYSIVINGDEKKFGKDLGVMPVPYGVKPGAANYEGTGGTTPALGGWNVAVNPNSKNKKEAAEVLTALTKDSYQLAMLKTTGWLPAKSKLMTSKEAKEVPIIGRYMDTVQVSAKNAIPRPVTAVWPQQSTKTFQAVNTVLSQGAKPADAMQNLKKELKAIDDQYA